MVIHGEAQLLLSYLPSVVGSLSFHGSLHLISLIHRDLSGKSKFYNTINITFISCFISAFSSTFNRTIFMVNVVQKTDNTASSSSSSSLLLQTMGHLHHYHDLLLPSSSLILSLFSIYALIFLFKIVLACCVGEIIFVWNKQDCGGL